MSDPDTALVEALAENRPLSDEQRNRLISLVRGRAARDLDSARYRWLRPRLELNRTSSLSGGDLRLSLEVRIGQSFFDTPTRGPRGYVDPQRFHDECRQLDEQVDAAIADQGAGRGATSS